MYLIALHQQTFTYSITYNLIIFIKNQQQFKIQRERKMLSKLQFMLFRKQYELVKDELIRFRETPVSLPLEDQLLYDMAKIRLQVFQITAQRKQMADFNGLLSKINQVYVKYAQALPSIVVTIHSFAMKAFLFEVETNVDELNKQQMERKFTKQISRLPSLIQICSDIKVSELIKKSLYFEISLLELYIKKNTRIKKKQQRLQLDRLSQMIQHLAKRQSQASVLCKRLYMIIIHLKLHNSNTFSNELPDQTLEYLEMSIKNIQGKEQTLINYDTVVVLLYNCLKIMLGFNQLSPALVDRLDHLYKFFDFKNYKRSYPWYILQMFFIIKIMIFKKKEQIEENDKIEQKLSQFSQKFSVFLNLNMDQIIVSLNQITRNIVRHKVASLSTMIGIKLGIIRFSKDFLQIMHDSPFNNDVQTIKLCFELFEFREFQKIQNLLQTVLSVPATKNQRMREVLVAMCSILMGLYFQRRQEGLLYGKLNHQNFLASKTSLKNKTETLRQQTFLEHVGFGYYNIACHQVYLQNRQIYLTKALQNFLLSYELNSQNYLLNYCLGKIYLQMYDYPNAYKHTMEACKSHRGSWAPFCLLACIYMCDRKFQKSYMLIQQLLKKYSTVPILHYVRAYLQVNKILLEVEHDEEIEAAKMLGQQYYTAHFERLLKHKSITILTQQCQKYFQLSMGQQATEPDQNFFSSQNIADDSENGKKYLFQIISLLQQVGQYNMIENIIKVLPSNNIETLYHKAVLHEKRKQIKQARSQYLNIIKLNHSHCPTLIKLALMPASDDQQSIKQCYEYLEIAGKYVNDGQFMLAKGIVLSKLGKFKESNKALLMNRDLAWCSSLPDLFYYY